MTCLYQSLGILRHYVRILPTTYNLVKKKGSDGIKKKNVQGRGWIVFLWIKAFPNWLFIITGSADCWVSLFSNMDPFGEGRIASGHVCTTPSLLP